MPGKQERERLWFGTSAQFTKPEERQRIGEMEKKGGMRKGVGTSGSHNASMRAILRTFCPMSQDVRMQEQATLVKPECFRKGLNQKERCLVGKEGNPHCIHYRLSYYLPERRSGLALQPCH